MYTFIHENILFMFMDTSFQSVDYCDDTLSMLYSATAYALLYYMPPMVLNNTHGDKLRANFGREEIVYYAPVYML